MSDPFPMVLVPTYMEAGTICRLVDQLRRHLPHAQVLIVDDQSPDGTAALVRERYAGTAGVEVVSRCGPRSYGAAMREGMQRFLASPATWLITIDADLSHDPALATRMLARIGDAGVVIGSRYAHGTARANWTVARMLISVLGNWYIRLITGLPAADCTSGFRCYTRAALQAVDPGRWQAGGYAFHVEALHAVWQAGHPLVEVPIVYRDRLVGESKLTLGIVLESLLVPWRLALRRERRARRRPAADPSSTPPVAPTPS